MKDTLPAIAGEITTTPGGTASAAGIGMAYEAAAQEVRITDAKTGGQKGSKLARFALIPAEFLWALAEHYGKGAKKYDDRNWERGYKWSLSVDALLRHLNQWLMGEDNDEETGTNHLIAVAWHACALFIFQLRKLGTDDVRSQQKTVEQLARERKDAIDDAHRNALSANPDCYQQSPNSHFVCNRPKGHTGRHVAVACGRFLEEWQ